MPFTKQSRKVAIVTGASDGVGYYTALDLARKGYHVVMACRNVDKATIKRHEIVKQLNQENGIEPSLSVLQLNLADRASIEAFAENIQSQYPEVALLIHNAGCVSETFQKTKDNLELTMQTNYFGPFLLTHLLMPQLIAAEHARIIQVGSFTHTLSTHRDNILFESAPDYDGGEYKPEIAYANSKFAAMAFCFELAKRLEGAGISSITCLCATPGATKTNMVTQVQGNFLMKANEIVTMLFGHSAEAGAENYMHAALSPDVKPGEYYGPACMWGLFGRPALTSTAQETRNRELAKNLWQKTESMLGITFDVAQFQEQSEKVL